MNVTLPRVIGFVLVATFCVGVALISGHRSAPSASATSTQTLIWGDVDCSGDIAPRDAQAILKNVLVQNPLSQNQPCPAVGEQVTVDGVSRIWGDVDCGGNIAPRDAQAILKNVLVQNPLSQNQPCPAVGSTVTLGAGSSPTPTPSPTQQQYQVVEQTCINGTFTGWSGHTLFETCSGELWLQSSYDYFYDYEYRPDVEILLYQGSYFLYAEQAQKLVPVTQVTNYVKSCITGTFNGWSGDTVFPLCNGQVWIQATFAFQFHFAFRPNVLIYWDGSQYLMKVDGVDGTIAVTRVQ
jgi:hypothetical protein